MSLIKLGMKHSEIIALKKFAKIIKGGGVHAQSAFEHMLSLFQDSKFKLMSNNVTLGMILVM